MTLPTAKPIPSWISPSKTSARTVAYSVAVPGARVRLGFTTRAFPLEVNSCSALELALRESTDPEVSALFSPARTVAYGIQAHADGLAEARREAGGIR